MIAAHVPGEVIVVRTVTFGQIRWASVAVAVRDDRDWIAFYSNHLNENKVTAGAARRDTSRRERELLLREELLSRRFPLVDKRPDGVPTPSLTVTRPGDWFSVRMRHRDGLWLADYVNICTPFTRTPIGFDTDDLCLDIVLDALPDGRYGWSYKDANDLDERASVGIYSSEDVKAIKAAGDHALSRLTEGGSPFDHTWRDWTPDEGWPIPKKLPDTWSEHLPSS